ncbi:DUF1778 domain-containing protein [Mycobacterium sp. TY815]|uniref:plasmid mobilization protein n=1 Tax=Mycobacterium sp. TY815 TaxID=3050581 RepID=UPI0027418F13|nr:DUF1778 domain-containing protein [Mycobacterium sp. TY815]MDP7706825.1 DUF1778 domain-containing protein [Mycobacterium sp. TY815]
MSTATATAPSRNRRGSETRQRTVMQAVRMLPEEKQALETAAKSAGVTVCQFIRDAALNKAWETGR